MELLATEICYAEAGRHGISYVGELNYGRAGRASIGFENRRAESISKDGGGGSCVIDFACDTDWTGLRN